MSQKRRAKKKQKKKKAPNKNRNKNKNQRNKNKNKNKNQNQNKQNEEKKQQQIHNLKVSSLLRSDLNLMNSERELESFFGKSIINKSKKLNKKQATNYGSQNTKKNKKQMKAQRIMEQRLKKANDRLKRRIHNRFIPSKNWDVPLGCGFKFEKLSSGLGLNQYTLVYDQVYERYRNEAMQVVETHGNPNLLGTVLSLCPYQLEALLSLYKICVITRENESALTFLGKALYAIDNAFPKEFVDAVGSGTARLQPKDQAVIEIFDAYSDLLQKKGCFETQFEVLKFALSLSPERDPCKIFLKIDNPIIKAKKWDYVLDCCKNFGTYKGVELADLPSFAYLEAFAKFLLNDNGADQSLQNAMKKFPQLVSLIIEKNSMTGPINEKISSLKNIKWGSITQNQFFARECQVDSISRLQKIFIERCTSLFKLYKRVPKESNLEKISKKKGKMVKKMLKNWFAKNALAVQDQYQNNKEDILEITSAVESWYIVLEKEKNFHNIIVEQILGNENSIPTELLLNENHQQQQQQQQQQQNNIQENDQDDDELEVEDEWEVEDEFNISDSEDDDDDNDDNNDGDGSVDETFVVNN
ncbi:nulp1-related [Anaeramoeba flamelloides]|uniref:Nulp1-related n=1 Tax=Anaeramoeba flamelloides TaxID=1746091 RepID=A0ABQ8YG76_9EUKA|nr:nulp1-related [Anaeramoeba flamelloides]